jgi:hypothetical protein
VSPAVVSQIVAAAEAVALALIHMLAGYVRQAEKRDPVPDIPRDSAPPAGASEGESPDVG